MPARSAGADRHPELLADVFTCLSNIFKHLSKHVAPQLASVLRNSAGLRYHAAAHVRQLAADAVGYLFRHTGQSGPKAAVQTVLSEAALHATPGELFALTLHCLSLQFPTKPGSRCTEFCVWEVIDLHKAEVN